MLYNAKTWNISFVAVSGNVFVFAGPDFHVLFLASLCVLLSAVPCTPDNLMMANYSRNLLCIRNE
jgi:hypothetical protein